MSILLDAVTRNKQQQMGAVIDPVLTPRAQYIQQRKMFPVKKVALLTLAMGLSVSAAWLLNQPHLLSENIVEPKLQAQAVAAPSAVSSPAVQVNEPSTSDPISSGVQIAGKVALPIAKTYVDEQQVMRQQQLDLLASSRTDNESGYDGQQEEASGFESSSYDEGANANAESEPEPIILGANANRRGLAELEALRRQVDVAASEVGLATLPQQEENNLVAAFEAALKDVEHTKAVVTPVTEAKLDPIEQTKADDIPSYGQLPAGLQLQVPEFNIVAHLYSSVPSNRWLNVDGAELQQGDMIKGKLKIIEIRPRDIILAIEGTEFKVPAI